MQRPGPDQGLPRVYSGRANFDHHLARPWRRHIQVRQVEHVGASETVEPHRACNRTSHLDPLIP